RGERPVTNSPHSTVNRNGYKRFATNGGMSAKLEFRSCLPTQSASDGIAKPLHLLQFSRLASSNPVAGAPGWQALDCIPVQDRSECQLPGLFACLRGFPP